MTLLSRTACQDGKNDHFVVAMPGSFVDDLGPGTGRGAALDGCRQYLMMIASMVIGPELQAKVGASDLVQETFLEAQKHIDHFRGQTETEVRAWLRAILECRVSNLRRAYLDTEKRAVRREVTLNSLGEEPGAGVVGTLRCPEPSPSNHAVRNEWSKDLEIALAHLPEHYRRVVALRHVEQLGWDEIGVQMACTAEAARKLWSRAIEQLRRQLGHHKD